MTLKERKMIHRIYEALNAVPGAHQFASTQTATISGIANYAADMSVIRNHLGDALMSLFDGSLTSEERDENFNAAMLKADEFISNRASSGWGVRGARKQQQTESEG